ncbi:MAG: antibiotic resistance protein MarC [Planctomycetaceae bacterium]|nr:antibiotic resistance protein MarC [Planctomycetaceae bacterium]
MPLLSRVASSYNIRMLDFATTAFVSILFLVDPPGTVPAFIALTAKFTPEKQRRTAFVASLTTTLTLLGFAVIGNVVFRMLGLTLPAFQIAGGFVLFLVALDMIRAQRSTQESPDELTEHQGAEDVAIAPLAIPMLAGPGALSTVAVLMSQANDAVEVSLVFAAILLTGLICWVTLRLAQPIQKRLGMTGIHIVGRVLGLVLAGIAVQFVLNGLAAANIIPKPPAAA